MFQSYTHGSTTVILCRCPVDRVAMDIVGPFPRSTQGNWFILVVQDHQVGYVLPDYTAQTVAKTFVYEFVSRFGASLEIHTI